ncbi:MAG: DNA repair protein RecO [Myxococcota bacterium]
MATLQCQALVVRMVDFGESDRIVHLLTPVSGRITAIAKGARRSKRRFPGTLDLFNLLAVQVERPRRASMKRLEHARLLRHFDALRVDPRRFALGGWLLEWVGRLAPEDGAGGDVQALFQFAVEALETLEREVPDDRLRMLLELRALAAVGLRPEFRRCVRCGRDAGAGPGGQPVRQVGFHLGEGGTVCAACSGGEVLRPVNLGTLRTLEQALSLPLDRLERLRLGPGMLREAGPLVVDFRRYHAGVELKSDAVVDAVFPPGTSSSPR